MNTAVSTVAMWETGQRTPPSLVMMKIADYFHVSVDYLLGNKENAEYDRPSEDIIVFPVVAGVAAGFDHSIDDFDTGEYQEIPRSLIRGRSPDEFLVFRVDGDSMSPKFLNGDNVLVSRQPSVDSGDIAIVSYDDFENGTVKKVYYENGCDFLDLIPLNSKYVPVRIQGEQLEGTRVIGKVVYLFRKI